MLYHIFRNRAKLAIWVAVLTGGLFAAQLFAGGSHAFAAFFPPSSCPHTYYFSGGSVPCGTSGDDVDQGHFSSSTSKSTFKTQVENSPASSFYIDLIIGKATNGAGGHDAPSAADVTDFENRVDNPDISIKIVWSSSVENSCSNGQSWNTMKVGGDYTSICETDDFDSIVLYNNNPSSPAYLTNYTIIKINCGNPLNSTPLPTYNPDSPPSGGISVACGQSISKTAGSSYFDITSASDPDGGTTPVVRSGGTVVGGSSVGVWYDVSGYHGGNITLTVPDVGPGASSARNYTQTVTVPNCNRTPTGSLTASCTTNTSGVGTYTLTVASLTDADGATTAYLRGNDGALSGTQGSGGGWTFTKPTTSTDSKGNYWYNEFPIDLVANDAGAEAGGDLQVDSVAKPDCTPTHVQVSGSGSGSCSGVVGKAFDSDASGSNITVTINSSGSPSVNVANGGTFNLARDSGSDWAAKTYTVTVKDVGGTANDAFTISVGPCAAITCGSVTGLGSPITVGNTYNGVGVTMKVSGVTTAPPIASGFSVTGDGVSPTNPGYDLPALNSAQSNPFYVYSNDFSVKPSITTTTYVLTWSWSIPATYYSTKTASCTNTASPIIAGYSPFFTSLLGDVTAGSGVGTTACTQLTADIKGSNNGINVSPNYYGAGTGVGAWANGNVTNFATGLGLSGYPGNSTAPSSPPYYGLSTALVGSGAGLAFSNTKTASPGAVNTTAGSYGGGFNGVPCISDYYGNGVDAATPKTASQLSNLEGQAGNFKYTGDLTLGAQTFDPGQNTSLYIKGNVYLTGDVTYGAYDLSGSVTTTTTTPVSPTAASTLALPRTLTDTLSAGQVMHVGQSLVSSDGGVRLDLQSGDGNMVVYGRNYWSTAEWSSQTYPYLNDYLSMQTDGNLVLRSSGGTVIWQSGTAGRGGTKVVMQSDGNLVIRNAANAAVWSLLNAPNWTLYQPSGALNPGTFYTPAQTYTAPWKCVSNASYAQIYYNPGRSGTTSYNGYYKCVTTYPSGDSATNFTGDAGNWQFVACAASMSTTGTQGTTNAVPTCAAYPTTTTSATNYVGPNIPRFNLYVSGNIYIAPSVHELHGTYIAQKSAPSSNTTGIVNTCTSAAHFGQTSFTESYATCNTAASGAHQSLLVVGAMAGETQIQLMRTYGNLAPASGTTQTAGEVFDYSPELWLATDDTSTNDPPKIQGYTSLPPVL